MVPVRIEGAPSSDSLVEESSAAVCGTAVLKQSTPLIASDNILVTIQTRDGLNIRKSDPCADMEPDEMRSYVRFLLWKLGEKQEQMNCIL